MNREQFIERLAFLLSGIPEEERDGVLDYYNDYFDEAGMDDEEDVARRLGTPETVASVILASMKEGHEENGEFTENGFEDQRFSDVRKYPDILHDVPAVTPNKGDENQQQTGTQNGYGQYGYYQNNNYQNNNYQNSNYYNNGYYQNNYKKPMSKSTKTIIIVIVCLCLSPLLLPLAGGIVAAVLGVILSVLGVFVALGVVGAVLVVVGLATGFVGLLNATVPGAALLVAGLGIVIAALGAVMVVAFIGLCGSVVPRIVRWIVGLCKKKSKKGGMAA